ncbi:protein mab-21-like 2 [Xenia sp. Carnegie-2017]|uniref:protein mab-21-like 2 n=1 Tax=Xenia sp. Carnegie-2017 TaxID=2897299 RepID=UPI001F03C697|nr:protein mab-21-like 2 [Xenia sp. Carnegie-2017]
MNLEVLLSHYFQTRSKSHLKRYGDVLQTIEIVLNPLLKELKRRDKRLRFERMSPNAFYRVRQRNVLEVFLVFKKFDSTKLSFVDVDSHQCAAFVSAKLKKVERCWMDLMVGGKKQGFFLSSEKLREYLCACLKDLSKKRSNDSVSNIWFDFTNNNEDGLVLNICLNDETIFVHLIPTLYFKDIWPDCASLWKTVVFRWPEDETRMKIINAGIHLTCEHVKSSLEHSSLLWRISFLSGEKILLNSTNVGCRNQCLQIAKTILEDYLSYPCGLTPYHLEIMILHLNTMITNPSLWNKENLSARFLDFLSFFQKSASSGSCQHFFVPSLQLFDGVPLQSIASRLREILNSPENFFSTFYGKMSTKGF